MKMNKIITIIVLVALVFGVGNSFVSAQTSSDSANTSDSIREKVQDKINEIKSNPKAFIGSITDISGTAIQIRNNDGLIEQISVADDTTFTKIDDEDETMEYEDVAIGDFILALGYLDETNVLQSSEIFVTATPDELTRLSAMGTVQDLESGDFTLQTSYGNSYDVITTKFTDVFVVADTSSDPGEILDIEEGDVIIVVGEMKDEELEAYHIQITKKADLPLPEDNEAITDEE